jgi:N-acetylmuramoyl-L-alanine amidase
MKRRSLERISQGLLVLLALVGVMIILLVSSSRLPALHVGASENPEPTLSGPVKRVGIVAGHWPEDPGAICPDGLREADINYAIAALVVNSLRQEGYWVDLLDEYDPALSGYQAAALVSLHVDSCLPGASGFKVARAARSAVPEEEDALVGCLYREYEEATGLHRHEGSITPEMLYYHTFWRIAPETPGAIIEMGFMADDADVLLEGQELAAQGIVSGILCFLGGSD